MDLESEGRAIDARELERLHRAKTGALLSACVRGGALLGGATEADLALLTRYAGAIGLAFQVVDDVLDATEGADQLGKRIARSGANSPNASATRCTSWLPTPGWKSHSAPGCVRPWRSSVPARWAKATSHWRRTLAPSLASP